MNTDTSGERRVFPVATTTAPRLVNASSDEFPVQLRDVTGMPSALWLRGRIDAGDALAVALVGARRATAYGLEQAERLAGDLARRGVTIVSGLARGIDAAAHRGALEAGGRTVAVIPSGLDAITPRHHRPLAAEIAARGTLLSEWAHGDPRGRPVFVQRNRLIAALASATVVVEAAERSGALSTAAAASRLRRPVLAVPGDVDRDTARGCHALLRRGAALCEQAADVLEAIGRAQAPADRGRSSAVSGAAPAAIGPAATAEGRMLTALDQAPRTVDMLAARSGLDVSEALAALLALQWAGVAVARPGQRWARGGR